MKTKDWISKKVETRKSVIQGKGVFANTIIKKGENIFIWGGNYVNKEKSDEFRKKGMLIMQWDDDLFSAENYGEDEGYFINHSCSPNMWMDDAHTLTAKRKINKGEELTADYALWEADMNYISKWICACGSANCRGRVTGKDWKDSSLQTQYGSHFSPLINKRIYKLK